MHKNGSTSSTTPYGTEHDFRSSAPSKLLGERQHLWSRAINFSIENARSTLSLRWSSLRSSQNANTFAVLGRHGSFSSFSSDLATSSMPSSLEKLHSAPTSASLSFKKCFYGISWCCGHYANSIDISILLLMLKACNPFSGFCLVFARFLAQWREVGVARVLAKDILEVPMEHVNHAP